MSSLRSLSQRISAAATGEALAALDFLASECEVFVSDNSLTAETVSREGPHIACLLYLTSKKCFESDWSERESFIRVLLSCPQTVLVTISLDWTGTQRVLWDRVVRTINCCLVQGASVEMEDLGRMILCRMLQYLANGKMSTEVSIGKEIMGLSLPTLPPEMIRKGWIAASINEEAPQWLSEMLLGQNLQVGTETDDCALGVHRMSLTFGAKTKATEAEHTPCHKWVSGNSYLVPHNVALSLRSCLTGELVPCGDPNHRTGVQDFVEVLRGSIPNKNARNFLMNVVYAILDAPNAHKGCLAVCDVFVAFIQWLDGANLDADVVSQVRLCTLSAMVGYVSKMVAHGLIDRWWIPALELVLKRVSATEIVTWLLEFAPIENYSFSVDWIVWHVGKSARDLSGRIRSCINMWISKGCWPYSVSMLGILSPEDRSAVLSDLCKNIIKDSNKIGTAVVSACLETVMMERHGKGTGTSSKDFAFETHARLLHNTSELIDIVYSHNAYAPLFESLFQKWEEDSSIAVAVPSRFNHIYLAPAIRNAVAFAGLQRRKGLDYWESYGDAILVRARKIDGNMRLLGSMERSSVLGKRSSESQKHLSNTLGVRFTKAKVMLDTMEQQSTMGLSAEGEVLCCLAHDHLYWFHPDDRYAFSTNAVASVFRSDVRINPIVKEALAKGQAEKFLCDVMKSSRSEVNILSWILVLDILRRNEDLKGVIAEMKPHIDGMPRILSDIYEFVMRLGGECGCMLHLMRDNHIRLMEECLQLDCGFRDHVLKFAFSCDFTETKGWKPMMKLMPPSHQRVSIVAMLFRPDCISILYSAVHLFDMGNGTWEELSKDILGASIDWNRTNARTKLCAFVLTGEESLFPIWKADPMSIMKEEGLSSDDIRSLYLVSLRVQGECQSGQTAVLDFLDQLGLTSKDDLVSIGTTVFQDCEGNFSSRFRDFAMKHPDVVAGLDESGKLEHHVKELKHSTLLAACEDASLVDDYLAVVLNTSKGTDDVLSLLLHPKHDIRMAAQMYVMGPRASKDILCSLWERVGGMSFGDRNQVFLDAVEAVVDGMATYWGGDLLRKMEVGRALLTILNDPGKQRDELCTTVVRCVEKVFSAFPEDIPDFCRVSMLIASEKYRNVSCFESALNCVKSMANTSPLVCLELIFDMLIPRLEKDAEDVQWSLLASLLVKLASMPITHTETMSRVDAAIEKKHLSTSGFVALMSVLQDKS